MVNFSMIMDVLGYVTAMDEARNTGKGEPGGDHGSSGSDHSSSDDDRSDGGGEARRGSRRQALLEEISQMGPKLRERVHRGLDGLSSVKQQVRPGPWW